MILRTSLCTLGACGVGRQSRGMTSRRDEWRLLAVLAVRGQKFGVEMRLRSRLGTSIWGSLSFC